MEELLHLRDHLSVRVLDLDREAGLGLAALVGFVADRLDLGLGFEVWDKAASIQENTMLPPS